MKYSEFVEAAEDLFMDRFYDFDFIGIRFEEKERAIGEIVTDCSRGCADLTNVPDWDDARDFPEYGTDEYEKLDELEGVCAYNLQNPSGWTDSQCKGDEEVGDIFRASHCYVLATNTFCEDGEDDNEIIMPNPEVIAVLF